MIKNHLIVFLVLIVLGYASTQQSNPYQIQPTLYPSSSIDVCIVPPLITRTTTTRVNNNNNVSSSRIKKGKKNNGNDNFVRQNLKNNAGACRGAKNKSSKFSKERRSWSHRGGGESWIYLFYRFFFPAFVCCTLHIRNKPLWLKCCSLMSA